MQKLRAIVAQLGLLNGLLYFCDRVLRRTSADRARLVRYLIVAQPVPETPAARLRASSTSQVRQVEREDPLVPLFPRPPEVIATRFADGAMCFVATSRERFAGFLWLAFDGYDEDEVRCRYAFDTPEISAWDYDVYVEPEYRLGRTFMRLWQAANQFMSTRGVRWTFSRISAFNAGSIAAHRRLGGQILHSATFLCIGRLQISAIGAAPFLHVSLHPDARPVVRVRPPA